MSGIIGIVRGSEERPQVLEAVLERMAESLAHRGPDGRSVWAGAGAGLGHLALHATPEAHDETLPLRASGRVLTCDARLDNREELLAELGAELQVLAGAHKPVPDSVLLLAAYERWGNGCAAHLLGDFAFAIWDEEAQQLFCARDHFGVKPFYFFHEEGERGAFAFASEIKALFEVPGIERRVDEKRIAKYLMVAFDSHEDTAFENVRRLPAAHTLLLDARSGRAELRRYWSLEDVQPLLGLSDADYEARFRDALFEAVRCRMRAPEARDALGGFLSGGLDSSAVMCVARQIEGETAKSGGREARSLPVFSAVFEAVPACDERPFIEAVLRGGGLEPHWIRGEERSPLMNLGRVLWHTDEPVLGPNLCSAWEHYGPARRAGVRVLLDGHGGDETVGYGLPRLSEMVQAGQWRGLWRELRLMERNGLLEGGQGARAIFERSLWGTLGPLKAVRRVAQAVARRLPRAGAGGRAGQQNIRPTREALVAEGFSEKVGARALWKKCHESEPRNVQGDRVYNERTLGAPLQSLAFEELSKAASAAGVEARYPLWDKRLVELCLSMPPEQKLRDGWTRSILRRALEGVLPREVQWRGSKVDFTPEAWHGLRAHDRAELERLAREELPFSAGYTNAGEAARAARAILESEEPQAGPSPLAVRAASLERWLEAQHEARSEAASSTWGAPPRGEARVLSQVGARD